MASMHVRNLVSAQLSAVALDLGRVRLVKVMVYGGLRTQLQRILDAPDDVQGEHASALKTVMRNSLEVKIQSLCSEIGQSAKNLMRAHFVAERLLVMTLCGELGATLGRSAQQLGLPWVGPAM